MGSDDDESEPEEEDEVVPATDRIELQAVDKLELLTEEQETEPPPLNSLILDVLYRPVELAQVCMWDQCSQFEKVRRRDGKTRRVRSVVVENESGSDSDSEAGVDSSALLETGAEIPF